MSTCAIKATFTRSIIPKPWPPPSIPIDPVSWPKAQFEIETSNGAVESVTEQEIADAKAVIGHSGIGCEPASAATLAGIRKLKLDRDADALTSDNYHRQRPQETRITSIAITPAS